MNKLYALIDKAIIQLNIYKHPNVEDCQKQLHEILMAAKLGGIIHDTMEDMYWDKDTLEIRTSYSVRSLRTNWFFFFTYLYH